MKQTVIIFLIFTMECSSMVSSFNSFLLSCKETQCIKLESNKKEAEVSKKAGSLSKWISVENGLKNDSLSKDTSSINKNIKKNSIYLELFGNGRFGSFNYDRIFFIRSQKFSFRTGIFLSPYGIDAFLLLHRLDALSSSYISELNYLIGDDDYYEPGIGISYWQAYLSSKEKLSESGEEYKTHYSQTIFLFVKPIGYRFQKKKGGLVIRTSVMVRIKVAELNKEYEKYEISGYMPIAPAIGISIGYSF